jgi:hypothetical protein
MSQKIVLFKLNAVSPPVLYISEIILTFRRYSNALKPEKLPLEQGVKIQQ